MKYRVVLVETVQYYVDIEADNTDDAGQIAREVWADSADPTADFSGMGEGVEVERVLRNPPNWESPKAITYDKPEAET